MFELVPTKVPGCIQINARKRQDSRGYFVKTYHRSLFHEHGLSTEFREEYYSSSNSGCLRGMHFQLPPHDHDKLVYCTTGTVLDVVVDLRRGSPTYGQAECMTLSGESGTMLFIPKGLAHGFYVLSGPSSMVYNVTTEYAPSHDTGIHWRSIPFDWPNLSPVTSERDSSFQPLNEFDSPFTYSPPQTLLS